MAGFGAASRDADRHGKASHGSAGLGLVWQCMVGHGGPTVGQAAAVARHGAAWFATACRGVARRGRASYGLPARAKAGLGAITAWPGLGLGEVREGKVRSGQVYSASARLGTARLGIGTAGLGGPSARRGSVWLAPVRCGASPKGERW